MADKTDTKKVKVLRDFTDAGTEKTFAAGETYDVTAGERANYVAGGLVADVDSKEPVKTGA